LAMDRHEVSSVLKDLEAAGLISLKPRPGTSALIVLLDAKPSSQPVLTEPSADQVAQTPGAHDQVAQTPGTHDQVARTPTLGGPAAHTRRPSHPEQEPVTRITNKNHEGALARAPAPVRGSTANRRRFSAAVEYARARLGALPNIVQREAVDEAVAPGEPTLLERWKRCVDAWRLAGHSPVNIAGVLDWLKAGGPPASGRPPDGGNGLMSRSAALRLRSAIPGHQAVRRRSVWTEEELEAERARQANTPWADSSDDEPAEGGLAAWERRRAEIWAFHERATAAGGRGPMARGP